MIKLIDINRIWEHPNNPRKDLGDLTELADSIKESGILQNLTLVKVIGNITGEVIEGTYTVIIGHRRLAAAKLAGLTEVPCIIAEMDEKTQVATMLLENMQRVDLTVYEQAQGFQMMINLGESVKDISSKTGFSESTVRRRTKLLDLDQEKLKESNERGGTLADYAKLEEIEDDELRNEVLATVGTDEFNWRLKRAITKEESIKERKKIMEILSSFAEQVTEKRENMSFLKTYYSSDLKNIEIPEDVGEKKYYFEDGDYHISLYKESEINDKEEEEKERKELERAERQERESKLEAIKRRSYELRSEFIEGISNTKAKRNMDAIIEATIYNVGNIYGVVGKGKMAELFKIETEEDEEISWDQIQQEIWKQPEKNLLTLIYNSLDDGYQDYYKWDLTYVENKELDYVYEFLGKLGYKLSEEEKQMKEGSHELYTEQEEKHE